MHVFGLGEETGVPGGNPRGTGRTCKLHTHMVGAGIEPPTLEIIETDFLLYGQVLEPRISRIRLSDPFHFKLMR
ncbi:hypothetical protein QTP86_034333 [Hemibagrus guttatus]|nr:hypothetical protein QTP86_034333 [Hemibagrus guttatus]